MRAKARALALLALLLAGAIGGASAASNGVTSKGVALHEAGIAALQEEMSANRLTSRELVEHFLARIEALDRKGPALRAVIEINPDALAIADRLDAERRSKGARGPMHGIPVLLKDNIDTADAMHTTAGSLALMSSRPAKDAALVTRLREAGAVILGKTNLSEWANMRSTRSSSGWSARGGQTRNPYDVQRNPCGSSSGSGVAVAAGFAVAAVGTETDGSIVCPSAINGIVGIKPSVGLVSRSGIVPISASQDTAGPMARSVPDAALLLAAMMGEDDNDPALAAMKRRKAPKVAIAPGERDLRGVRIGVARNLAGFHEGVDGVFNKALGKLKAAGAVIVDPVELKAPKSMQEEEFTVLLYEFKDGLNRYLATRGGEPRTLAELITYNRREREREMPYFAQELFLEAEAKGPLTDPAYLRARSGSLAAAGVRGIDAALTQHKLDVIIAPTAGPAWVTDLVNGDHFIGGDASSMPAIAGYPHITVPAGFVHGLPVGLSFISSGLQDQALIEISSSFERISAARKPPALPRLSQ